jgi:hypothetical protein
VFTEPLPSNDRGNIRTDTETDERGLWRKPLRWAQVCSGIQKLIGGIHRHTDTMEMA